MTTINDVAGHPRASRADEGPPGPISATIIESAEAWLSVIPVETVRTDAVQSFLNQETVFVRLRTSGGHEGVGYSYTIGTGGPAVVSLLRQRLLGRLVGMDSARPEHIWTALRDSTRATTPGLLTSLALAAVDTAVWDVRGRTAGLALWQQAGGALDGVPLYDTEGGWLHLSEDELVEHAIATQKRGLSGVKVKVGKPHISEDVERLSAVRRAVGDRFDIMADANQSFRLGEAVRRARAFEEIGIAWFEEPMPADDVVAHARLAASTSVPIAVGETLYTPGQFREYLQAGGASVIQVDVARVGGVTPWLKVAHLAETYDVAVAPHFLMEIHAPLVCAIPNGAWLEHIPQLRAVTNGEIEVRSGRVVPSTEPGIGIDWRFEMLEELRAE